MSPAAQGLHIADAEVRRGDFSVRLDAQIGPAQIVALIGRNGSGKSSVLQAVAGLLPVHRGRLELGGAVLDGPGAIDGSRRVWTEPEKRRAGVVPQSIDLFRHLSALENVAFGLRAQGVSRKPARGEAVAWLERVGLAEFGSVRASQLSGGQAQRVALARALASRPRMLLLDEPFTAIDAGTRPAMRALVRDAVTELAVPTLLISHDHNDVDGIADATQSLDRP